MSAFLIPKIYDTIHNMETIEILKKQVQTEEDPSIKTGERYLAEAHKIMKHHKPGIETTEELNEEDALLKFTLNLIERRDKEVIDFESEINAFGNLPIAQNGELISDIDENKTKREKLIEKFKNIASVISKTLGVSKDDNIEWFKETLKEILKTVRGTELLKKEIGARRGKEFVIAVDMLNTSNIAFDEKSGKYIPSSRMN